MNVILDTSIIVEYSIDGIKDFIINDDRVFLTDIILQEMDGHKNSEEAKGYNAREFFRQMGNAKSEKANLSDIVLNDNDYISKYTLSNGLEIYTIVRNRYNSRDINDSKIIEIAKDYNLKLITRDMAQSVRAKAMGVEVEVVTGDSVITKAKDEKDIALKADQAYEKIKNMNIRLVRDLKDFCRACDKHNGKFDSAKNEVILKTYKIINFLSKKVEENKRNIYGNYKSNSSSSDYFKESSDYYYSSAYSHFGGNIHNDD